MHLLNLSWISISSSAYHFKRYDKTLHEFLITYYFLQYYILKEHVNPYYITNRLMWNSQTCCMPKPVGVLYRQVESAVTPIRYGLAP